MPKPSRWAAPTTAFTLSHVAPLGVTADMLRWAERSGRVTRLAQGVFIATQAVAVEPVAKHLQLAQAHQLRNPGAIAAFETAALAWELDLDDTESAADAQPRFIAAPRGPARSARSAKALTAVRRLPPEHRVAHPSGLIVTSAARTAVDIAGESALGGALVVLDSFARLALAQRVGQRGLRAAYTDERKLDRSRQPLLRTVPAAATLRTRRWLAEVVPQADPRREAASESRSYALLVGAGLPVPTLQPAIESPDGVMYPDFFWPAQRVFGEVDGAVKYKPPGALVIEKRRQEGLERIGFIFVRWMAEEVFERPWVIVQRVHDKLRLRG